jgi:hypothetical protein
MQHSGYGLPRNPLPETVWKIVRVASRPYFSPTCVGKNRPLYPFCRLTQVPVLGLFGISKQFLQALG